MATWQFDMHALPSAAVTSVYGCTPLVIPRADMDDQEWWKNVVASDLRSDLAKLLPFLKSWSSGIEQWGYEDGDRIDILWQHATIADLFIRVDVRNVSHVFLVGLLELLRRKDWLLRTQDGRVFRPSLTKLLSAIHKSEAFHFVRDPDVFLAALDRARQAEQDDPTN